MKQLPSPLALRPLLLVCGFCFAAAPAFAGTPLPPLAPTLTNLIQSQGVNSEIAICPSSDAPLTIKARVISALTIAAQLLAEPGFELIEDVEPSRALAPNRINPGTDLAPSAIRLAKVEQQSVRPAAPAKIAAKSGALAHLADIPGELADKAKALSAHIVQRFKVDEPYADKVVKAAFKSGEQTGLPPNLLLAVIAVESSFKPAARNGNARGLMQIIPFWHKKKVNQVGGEQELMKADKNIAVGSAILKEYLDGSENIFQALKRYNASSKAHAYSEKVLRHKRGFDAISAPAIR